jgi:sec-independent protein translocase protein TatB
MNFSETIFLFFLALIIFGPKKLPEIARQIGKVLAEFRRASNEFKTQIEHEIANLEVEKKMQAQTILPPVPAAPEGTAARTLNAAPSEEPASHTDQSISAPDEVPGNTAIPHSEHSLSTDTGSSEAPATLAVSNEVAATAPAEGATEALPDSHTVTNSSTSTPTSQESHV